MTRSSRGRSGTWLPAFLSGADRPGVGLWGQLVRVLGCPGAPVATSRMCRGIRFAWLAVMLVFEYDRECPSPRCCRGS